MNIRTQIVVAVILLAALAVIINMVRCRRLELRYAQAWLGVGIGTLLLDCFPELMSWMADQVGIATPANMLFFFGFLFALMIIFILTVVASQMSVKIKNLAQEIAFLEKELEDCLRKQRENEADCLEEEELERDVRGTGDYTGL